MRFVAAGALLSWLALAPVAQGRTTANPTLDVTFSTTGAISVTLPDGTTVGSASGAPSVIPAGYYTVLLSAPGECVQIPLFQLKGPGENIQSDMSGGELNTMVLSAYFAPNSTYTWSDYANPTVAYAFTTSATVVGSPASLDASSSAAASSSPAGTSSGTQQAAPTSQDVVGSAITTAAPTIRGALAGAVSAAGKLSLRFKGRYVASLSAGRYTLTVTDASTSRGFTLGEMKHQATSLTGTAFTGTRSLSVDLTAGQWFFASGLSGPRTYFIVGS
jgi:hypothetical protein